MAAIISVNATFKEKKKSVLGIQTNTIAAALKTKT